MMRVLTDIPFRVNRDALLKRLHLDADSEYAADIQSLAAKAEAVGQPKAIYDEVLIESIDEDGIRLGGVRFASRVMAVNLRNVDRVFPYICTCGVELDEISIPPDDDFGRFGLDIVKEMALHQAATALNDKIRLEFGLEKKANMNPGSGDRTLWPIEEQRPLFKLMGDVKSAIGVILTDSFLMLPNKSISGFYFKTDKEFHNCQLCKRVDCPNRQTPFDQDLWTDSMMDPETESAK